MYVVTKVSADRTSYWKEDYFHYNLNEAKLYSSMSEILRDTKLTDSLTVWEDSDDIIRVDKVDRNVTITHEDV